MLLLPPPFDEKSNVVLVLFSGKGVKTVGKCFDMRAQTLHQLNDMSILGWLATTLITSG